ncbi:MAG: response regulator transcription factor [Sediminibacterium sp.]|nr:response regulator transcription factor [Sediminibacterium sp.]
MKKTKQLTLLIIDDHQMVRDGIRSMLENAKTSYDFSIEEASNAAEGIFKVKEYNYDVVLIDYQLPDMNGAECAVELLKYKPELKILAISNHDEFVYMKQFIDAGTHGFSLKNITPKELVKAIEMILANQQYYSSEVALAFIRREKHPAPVVTKQKVDLTKREAEILKLITEEYTNKEIAEKLSLASKTIGEYRQNLLLKLQVKNTAGLVKKAIQYNLV